MNDLTVNSASRRDVRIVGNEKTPVIVLDDPIVSTKALIDYAVHSAAFGPGGDTAYPGIRADLPAGYAEVLAPQLFGLISHVYNVPREAKPHLVHQLFSLVTTRPEELAPLQRLPHTDSRFPYYFATVHHLSSTPHAGTGFFRHRPTGYERISPDRYEPYKQAAREYMATSGLPGEQYINGSDDHYELIGTVEHRPNRMAIYPGNLLHSGLIMPDRDISDDPATGRLTANLFVYFTPD